MSKMSPVGSDTFCWRGGQRDSFSFSVLILRDALRSSLSKALLYVIPGIRDDIFQDIFLVPRFPFLEFMVPRFFLPLMF